MRIAIVNDSVMAVEALSRVVRSVPQNQIAWVASDGAQAVARCAEDTPDLILMDLYMPVMGGVEATRRIMARTPCAILIVTAATNGHAPEVFGALGAGALDAVDTPRLGAGGAMNGGAGLIAKIRTVGILTGLGTGRSDPQAAFPTGKLRTPARCDLLVAIGASAGGPAALASILASLPRAYPGALVIVQHVDAQFAPLLTRWLNERSSLPVRLAREGDRPEPGVALVAGTGDHLALSGARSLGYTPDPRDLPYRPSIDLFFESVVRHWRGRAAGVLLTGMGRDGAMGLKALRDARHTTLAQDQATSAVYGMPKAAAEMEAAHLILPLQQIAPRLVDLVRERPAMEIRGHSNG